MNDQLIALQNFDDGYEPEIRLHNDKTVSLVFQFFPPQSFEMTVEDLKSFLIELQTFIDTEVIHEDREIFFIVNPKPDTINNIIIFINTYRHRKGYNY